ncbi:Ada metal-binding domain-containing protein [Pseudomonas sp. NPDC089530]|uniref:Ada metal-binding domain-containing protein n=1 Tax=Pseudomonas sp. NPDC089530 TaxID=3390651 RepID=UPI003D00AFF7
MNADKRWVLLDAHGESFFSAQPGTLGGHRGSRIYGRLDCPAALRAIARGGYVGQRVFFLDEASAHAAGYRPCARCLPLAYAAWRTSSHHPPP